VLVSFPLASVEVAVVTVCGAKVSAELVGVSEYCVLAVKTKTQQNTHHCRKVFFL
jgi:sRNA-binding regulator protein Hfq